MLAQFQTEITVWHYFEFNKIELCDRYTNCDISNLNCSGLKEQSWCPIIFYCTTYVWFQCNKMNQLSDNHKIHLFFRNDCHFIDNQNKMP